MYLGNRVGLMTSPHISCVRERVRVNNRLISENDFADRLDNLLNIENVINILQKDENPNDEPFEASFFELMTVLGFDYFAQMKCNFAVIEVGLGYVYAFYYCNCFIFFVVLFLFVKFPEISGKFCM